MRNTTTGRLLANTQTRRGSTSPELGFKHKTCKYLQFWKIVSDLLASVRREREREHSRVGKKDRMAIFREQSRSSGHHVPCLVHVYRNTLTLWLVSSKYRWGYGSVEITHTKTYIHSRCGMAKFFLRQPVTVSLTKILLPAIGFTWFFHECRNLEITVRNTVNSRV